MTDVEQRNRPGVAFAGFVAPFALLVAVMAAYRVEYFADLGWRGGEYAYAFIGVAAGSIVVGLVLKFFGRPWTSVGTGMVLAGTLGVVIAVALVVLIVVAWSRFSSTS